MWSDHETQGGALPAAEEPWREREWPGRAAAAEATFLPGGWVPPPPLPPRRRRRGRVLAASLAAVLVVAVVGGGLGYLAYHNDQVARKWRHLDRAQAAATKQVAGQLATANSRIATLDRQLAGLGGEISSLQGQLSRVADQKEKAVDQETVLQQLLSAAGTVADDLQQCISATNAFQSDLDGSIGFGSAGQLSQLESEAQQVDQICGQAESANQDLQSAIQSAP